MDNSYVAPCQRTPLPRLYGQRCSSFIHRMFKRLIRAIPINRFGYNTLRKSLIAIRFRRNASRIDTLAASNSRLDRLGLGTRRKFSLISSSRSRKIDLCANNTRIALRILNRSVSVINSTSFTFDSIRDAIKASSVCVNWQLLFFGQTHAEFILRTFVGHSRQHDIFRCPFLQRSCVISDNMRLSL